MTDEDLPDLDELRKTAVTAVIDFLEACEKTGTNPMLAMGQMMGELQAAIQE